MSTMQSAIMFSTSGIYCSQLEKYLKNLTSKTSVTNYVLSYSFLILATETYLSGLFPRFLGLLSGKRLPVEIISYERSSRKNLDFSEDDFLYSWYCSHFDKNLIGFSKGKKDWDKYQIPAFLAKLKQPLSQEENNELYSECYAPLFEVRNTLFHRDELVSGDMGPDSFVDKYFTYSELEENIKRAQSLITFVHKRIGKFIESTNFQTIPRPYAVFSEQGLRQAYSSYQRSIEFLMNYHIS